MGPRFRGTRLVEHQSSPHTIHSSPRTRRRGCPHGDAAVAPACCRQSRRTAPRTSDTIRCRQRPRPTAMFKANWIAMRHAGATSRARPTSRAYADIRPAHRTAPDRICSQSRSARRTMAGINCASSWRTGSRRWRAVAHNASPASRARRIERLLVPAQIIRRDGIAAGQSLVEIVAAVGAGTGCRPCRPA